MDNITTDWIKRIETLAMSLERGENVISEFSNDQLHYLIYWNFGYSGIDVNGYTIMCEDELNKRGIRYSEKLAESINEKAEELY